jgi:hypothetical protein
MAADAGPPPERRRGPRVEISEAALERLAASLNEAEQKARQQAEPLSRAIARVLSLRASANEMTLRRWGTWMSRIRWHSSSFVN